MPSAAPKEAALAEVERLHALPSDLEHRRG
jgi:hypothetical protein